MEFVEHVYKFIVQNNMIGQKDTVIVGVSGGADSVCLLCVLEKLRQRTGFELKAIHVNHGIRGDEANEDEEFVRLVCSRLDVPLEQIHRDVPAEAGQSHMSLEEAGRKARYEEFAHLADRLDHAYIQTDDTGGHVCIAVAHHMDDQAETLLHNLVRGSFVKGLSAMAPVSRIKDGGYKLIRPLLCVTRRQIEEYLGSIEQQFRTDSSNADNTYTRNKLRNVVIPYLSENINEQAVHNMARTAEQMLEVRRYMENAAEEAFLETAVMSGDYIFINISKLQKLDIVIRRAVIYNAIVKAAGAAKDITSTHVETVMGLVDKNAGSRADIAYRLCAYRDYDTIRIGRGGESLPDGMWYSRNGWYKAEGILICDCNAIGESDDLSGNDYTKWIDYDKIKFNIQLRTRQTGDYICINADGGTRKLKEYLIDMKVPRDYRDRVLVVADGHEIVWVVGFRISERYRRNDLTANSARLRVE